MLNFVVLSLLSCAYSVLTGVSSCDILTKKDSDVVSDEDEKKAAIVHTAVGNHVATSPTKFMLKREKTGQIIRILYGSHVIGRSETLADYCIEGNKMIGRTHATLIASNKECVIVDNKSLNKTCINGAELDPNTQYALRDGDVIKIANELFAFYSD